ncbi:hypothetical protein DPMN_056983 [Dreissena polymorpha]|uniref:Uncharacterized protein n=1 Tax=Dreissena polymorpha TaxID=45954 RepID=A0A9D4CSQ4_DREPO|nr:hypothetical protein DPMN_056983 [Dreissena polymorpha]
MHYAQFSESAVHLISIFQSKALKQTLLAAHLILLSALTTTMVVLIVMNDYEYAL